MNNLRFWVLIALVLSSGCAKGALWRLGYLSPQARKQWAEEEQYAKTWQTQKAEMTAAVDRANTGGAAEQQRVASQLASMIKDDHRVLVRLHATQLLAKLPADPARGALIVAADDPEADVRIAACQVMARHGDSDSLIQLQKILGGDTNPDVRIAATRAIGEFKSPTAAAALSLAIDSDQPALQLAAADSLQKCTGEKFGHDIPKWQTYLADLRETKSSGQAGTEYPEKMVQHLDEGKSIRSFFTR